MTPIAAAWFEERGGLHDARIRAIDLEGATLRITIDDEWANEHNSLDGGVPGTLVFDGTTILEGDVTAARDGWLNEVEYRGDSIVFDFCDRDTLIIRASTVAWKSKVR